ncbi:MAG: type II toxin-antitoxin system PemK/MazF family toxin [Candidatus Pacebacteria bacterium]|nr:type II toxin-antitoxin system PemK/MazF family toxin [Candidatus Paceibacterota bacterium]
MLKRFLEWIGVKEKLHSTKHEPPFFKEGELWWCFLGENIGVETNGKGNKFTRPVLVFKKYDRFSFFAIPLTTKIKPGTWYCPFKHNNFRENACLAQCRVLSHKRLCGLIGKIGREDYKKIEQAFASLHKLF